MRTAKKKAMALFMCVAMLSVAAIGGTLAWYTDTEGTMTNVFSVGGVDIELSEKAAINDKEIEVQDGAEYTGVMPGDELTKEVTVKNTGNSDAYVRVFVTLNKADVINKAIDERYEGEGYTPEQIQAVYDEVFAGWGLSYSKDLDGDGADDAGMRLTITGDDMPDGVDYVDSVKTIDEYTVAAKANLFENETVIIEDGGFPGYYSGYENEVTKTVDEEEVTISIEKMGTYEIRYVYYMKLDAGKSVTLFEGLNAPAYFDEDQMKMFDGLNIDVYAEAIQTANIGNYQANDESSMIDAYQKAFAAFAGEELYDVKVSNSKELAEAISAADEPIVIALENGEYTTNLKIEGGKDVAIIGNGADTVLSGQIATTASNAGTLTLKNLTVNVSDAIVDSTGISQTGKSAIAIWGDQTVICENVTFNMSLADSTAITSWWDTGVGTSIVVKSCTFNCNGQRPIRATGNVTVENCTFNDPYRYAVQLTAKTNTATELDKAVINFNGNTIVNGENGKGFVYGIQLEGADYGCHDCVINGSGNKIENGGTESTMYYCECGEVDHGTIEWNVEVEPVHEG